MANSVQANPASEHKLGRSLTNEIMVGCKSWGSTFCEIIEGIGKVFLR
jgi:hypothetical protein